MYTHISLGLATAVQCVAIHESVPNAARALYHAHLFYEDILIVLATSMAYSLSVVLYVYQLKETPFEVRSFFETSTLLVTLILLSRVVNEFARYEIARSVSFRSLQLNEALLVRTDPKALMDHDPKTKRIDSRLLQHGDRFKVPPHTKVVTDGIVICGGSEVDESRITGESIPVAKGVQSVVYAGSTNGSGTLVVELTALPHENTLHRIATRLEDTELTTPTTQALTNRIATWLVPVIIVITLATFLTWFFVERHHGHSYKTAIVTATTYAIATLTICSPQAIRLAVPTIILVANNTAARHGIISHHPQALATAHLATDIVFDNHTHPSEPLTSNLLARGIALHTMPPHCNKQHTMQALLRRKGSTVLLLGTENTDTMETNTHITLTINTSSSSSSSPHISITSPSDLPSLIDISRATHRRFCICIAWLALYIVFSLALAAGVFAGVSQGRVRMQAPWVGLGLLLGVGPVYGVAWSVRWGRWG
ncbi:hypothetical protein J1614_010010 [Plenodomus biglobosus]|nr:hypothetical protein J1614_010010 [Plenodomus biglobosus]